MKRTKDLAVLIRKQLEKDPDLAAAVEGEALNAKVAMLIYKARNDAGLTQQELAERIGTKQSVIARLEDADYDGHSLSMLRRIAEALKMSLHLEFVPRRKRLGSREQRTETRARNSLKRR